MKGDAQYDFDKPHEASAPLALVSNFKLNTSAKSNLRVFVTLLLNIFNEYSSSSSSSSYYYY